MTSLVGWVLAAVVAANGTITLSWAPPTTYVDGTPIPSVDSMYFNLYQMASPTDTKGMEVQDLLTGTSTQLTVPEGQQTCWAVTALDIPLPTTQRPMTESALSNVVCKTVGTVMPAVPNPPSGLRIN
ncbi:MAG: hypothetical protein KGL39_24595 [Patescibacteria group bacterium]|nr:hypothetical protein [Patescibacteria group bacterium]